jgi:4-methoxybenzoate monooxygenase (O-demethylating)
MSLSQQIPVLDLDPFADDFLADPYAHYESLRQAGPVLRLGRYDLWAMARYEQVFTALRDHDTYCSSAGVDAGADAGEVTEEEAALLVRSLLSAGVDTTVASLGAALHCFAIHPGQWALLRDEPALARAAFEEVLRYASPVQTFFRTTTTDVAGPRIPAGEKVLLFLGAANRDPAQWGEDADAFDIRHRSAGHVAFGLGIHGCVGQAVARLEAEVLLTALARRVRTIEPAGEPKIRLNNTMHGFAALPVRVTPLS